MPVALTVIKVQALFPFCYYDVVFMKYRCPLHESTIKYYLEFDYGEKAMETIFFVPNLKHESWQDAGLSVFAKKQSVRQSV